MMSQDAAYPAKLAYRGGVAEEYDRERLGDAYRRFVWRREFLAIRRVLDANVAPGATVLDAPTGTGRFLPLLMEFGLKVSAGDISREMLKAARRRVPRADFARCDAEFLPFRDGAFDHVFSLRFLGHLPTATRIRVLREFARIARRGLIVGYPVLNPVTGLKSRAANLIHRLRVGRDKPWWPATEESLKDELRRAGLRIVDRVHVFRPLEQVSLLYLVPTARRPASARDAINVGFTATSLVRSGRWHPVLREFARAYPRTLVLVGQWPGFIRGHEGAFRVKRVPGVRYVPLVKTGTGDVRGFSWVSPAVFIELMRLRLHVILTIGFSLWTLYAALVRLLIGTRVVLLWQGVSPETGGNPGTLRLRWRRLLARGIDAAVTNTDDGARYLRDLVRVPSDRIVNAVYEVADRDALRETGEVSSSEPGARPQFLFVGRLTRGKGVHVLLEACRLLLSRGLTSFSVVLVGSGSQERELRALSSRLGLEGHVSWKGPVPQHEVGRFYEGCDAFVLASLEDTWGVAVMEAMAFGKPVLCSKLAGVRRVVRHGVNGFVFDPERPEELAGFMERLIGKPDLMRSLAKQSEAAAEFHTPERAARVLGEAVTLALDGSRPGHPLPQPLHGPPNPAGERRRSSPGEHP